MAKYKVLIRNGKSSFRVEYCKNIVEVKRLLPTDKDKFILDCETQYSKNEVIGYVKDSAICQIFKKTDETFPEYIVMYADVIFEPDDVYKLNEVA